MTQDREALRRALHAAVDAFVEALEPGAGAPAPRPTPPPPPRRRRVVPPPPELPVSDVAMERARRLLRGS